MTTASPPRSVLDRRIAVRLTPRSLAPHVRSALGSLGYVIDEDETSTSRPAIWLVDEDRLDECSYAGDESDARVVVISTSPETPSADPRIIGRIARPGRLNAIYALAQWALEKTPRRDPRIQTQLAARCIRANRRSIGAVVSLSEGGCLLRTDDRLKKGAGLEIQFALPDFGLISTIAECRYVRRAGAGLAFAAPSSDIKHTISHFVTLKLAEVGSTHGAPLSSP
jgi:hypothetical protein